MHKQGLTGVCVLLAVGLAATANARGPGVKAGKELVFHPRFKLAGGLDNNVFYDATDESDSPPNSATVGKFGGGLALSNRNPSRVALDFDGGFTFRFLMGVRDDEGVIAQEAIDERNSFERAKVSAVLGILPKASFSPRLVARYEFSDRPVDANTAGGFRRNTITLGPDLRFRPGARPESRAFETTLGYRLRLERYSDADRIGVAGAEKDAHQILFKTRWRFLPKTSLLLNVSFLINDYAQQPRDTNNPDSKPLTAEMGLQGLITRRVSVILKGGYVNTFNTEGERYSGPSWTGEIAYRIEPTLHIKLGYKHTAVDTSFSNFYVLDSLYAQAELHFLGGWAIKGRGQYDLYDYSQEGAPDPRKRDDPVVRSNASLGYTVRQWLTFTGSWEIEQNLSDFRSPAGVPEAQQDSVAYSRQLVLLSVSGDY